MSESNSPVHATSADTTRWSRANFAEAIQGVQTPLGWTFWDHVMETSVRQAFVRMGVFSRSEIEPPDAVDEMFSAAFFGLPAGNVQTLWRIGESMPGTSGDAVVEQMFGERRPEGADKAKSSGKRRYPIVAVKLPMCTRWAAKTLRPILADQRVWWRQSVITAPPADYAAAVVQLKRAADEFIRVGSRHASMSLIGQGIAEQIEGLAEQAWGSRDRAADLMTGYGSMEETELMGDLWEVAQEKLSLEEFLARHGYHGPDEGNLASTIWREDPAPVKRMAEQYRVAKVAHPKEKEAAQLARREAAEKDLLAALGRGRRGKAKLILKLGKALIPMREVGKAGFLHAIDGARCAARVMGDDLVARGLLDARDDVFFLTYDELVAGVNTAQHAVVAERKADHERFKTLDVPQAWTGNPTAPVATPKSAETTALAVEQLTGIGVFGDEDVSGRARVALDPAAVDLEPGDILVCKTTDPSWTPLFLVAEALVIDTGGQMSHGAIVARELGVPCVINTLTGTRDIPDGAHITVNGTTGVVTIKAVEPA
ncbi:PEP-utilizing enzyme [Sporichthya sp.]|uniref:PEP-utilizing enzyme n=1 Tax=Sporichthya sp. TaxID=65475 RepID=UPI0017B6455A|nr:PEP-utilizing enzyme [Sporichthya sp.]MBA3743069.1 phosphoenolpyruvate carboxykinase [Sporichthya sp.]